MGEIVVRHLKIVEIKINFAVSWRQVSGFKNVRPRSESVMLMIALCIIE
jgi:hypothetical protein